MARLKLPFCLLAALAAGSGCSSQSATDGGITGERGSPTGERGVLTESGVPVGDLTGGPLGTPCTKTSPCSGNQVCYNGECVSPCGQPGDCPAHQYCASDKLCHARTVTTCPAVPCLSSQVCASGLCTTPPPNLICGFPIAVTDGCEETSICLPNIYLDGAKIDDRRCFSFPACQEDDSCPVGTHGALCNTGQFPDKGRFCIASLCDTAAECPPDWHCIQSASKPYGYCSDGREGSLCKYPSDCLPPTYCSQLGAGTIGTCRNN